MTQASAEEESWKLTLSRMQHDLQLMRLAKKRLQTHDSTVYHQKLMHRQQAWEVSKQAAQAFLGSHCLIVKSSQATEVLKAISNFNNRLNSSFGLAGETAMLVLLNWSAVSRVKDETQACQAQSMGVLLNRHKHSAVRSPGTAKASSTWLSTSV